MSSIVAIQGVTGSFHDEAARQLVGSDIKTLPCDNFAAVFKAVKSGAADYGVVAVENSINGSINIVYRLLAREQLWVSGETFLHIEQYLIAAQKSVLADNNHPEAEVISHPVALAQCELWLDEHLPAAQRRETHDTADSVRQVVAAASTNLLAIAGKEAAELYGGHIVAGPINDDEHNYTRFFLLSKERKSDAQANKTSIILQTAHEPGSLQRALQLFADKDINLSKLDSHPIPGDEWHYAFYVDFEIGLETPIAQETLKALEQQGCKVTVLGSYQAAKLPS